LGELRFPIETSIAIHYHNQSVIQVADNMVAHSNIKHVELHFHYLRQLAEDKVFTLVYFKIDYWIVDIFTKPLFEAKFIKFHTLIGLQEAIIGWGCRHNYIS
jgi:hypothetical protein